MESDDMVKTVIKLFMDEEKIKYASTHSCELRNLIDEMQCILSIQIRKVAFRWRRFFDEFWFDMLSCHYYLERVMFACVSEHKCHQNIFDSFISVCAVLKFLSEEIFWKTRMNVRFLNSDIITELYVKLLKPDFCRTGGWRKFVEYIHNHEYFQWDFDHLDSAENPAVYEFAFQMQLEEKFESTSLRRELYLIPPLSEVDHNICINMATALLSTTSAKFPDFPNDLNYRIGDYKIKEKTENLLLAKSRFVAFSKIYQSNSKSESITELAAKFPVDRDSILSIIEVVNALECSKKSAEQEIQMKPKSMQNKTNFQEIVDRFLIRLISEKKTLPWERELLKRNTMYCKEHHAFNLFITDLLATTSIPVSTALSNYFDALMI